MAIFLHIRECHVETGIGIAQTAQCNDQEDGTRGIDTRIVDTLTFANAAACDALELDTIFDSNFCVRATFSKIEWAEYIFPLLKGFA